MSLVGPYLFIFVGVIVGLLTTRLFSKNPLRYLPNVVAGVVGSFAGLLIRDVMDITFGGKLSGALLAAFLGALVLTVAVNLIYEILFARK